jgi:N-(2-amino-2-carboxyethyl)-L-glutamate synthase
MARLSPREEPVGPKSCRVGRIEPSVLGTVGNTPIVELRRYAPDLGCTLLAKLEGFNPAGSSKDRPARRIIEEGLESGRLEPGMLVVESSSGNMGIGLAQACAYHGLRLVCVVDPKTNQTNIDILRAYGAEVDCVLEPDPATGDFLPARLERVRQWLALVPGAFWPNQYANEENSRSHAETTMAEILEVCGEVDYLFVTTSTCGTVRGCAEVVRRQGLATRVIAVDAVGSVIFGGERKKRLLPGMGAAIVPPLCPVGWIDQVVLVSDLDSIVGCRRLLRREAIFAGASSGGAVVAAQRVLADAAPGARAVVILPDRGERYLGTVFSDAWVQEHFGAVASLWQEPAVPAAHDSEIAWGLPGQEA